MPWGWYEIYDWLVITRDKQAMMKERARKNEKTARADGFIRCCYQPEVDENSFCRNFATLISVRY